MRVESRSSRVHDYGRAIEGRKVSSGSLHLEEERALKIQDLACFRNDTRCGVRRRRSKVVVVLMLSLTL